MPLTLEKLFSTTVVSTFEFDGDVVHLTWAPSRYTGEMDALAEKLSSEEAADAEHIAALEAEGDDKGVKALISAAERRNAATVRRCVAQLLVAWDVLDGTTPVPHDEAGLLKLPDWFVQLVFLAMAEENQTDPTNAPSSDDGSRTESSEPVPTGSPSSGERKPSTSRRGK